MASLPACRVKSKQFVQISDEEAAIVEADTNYLKLVDPCENGPPTIYLLPPTSNHSTPNSYLLQV